MHHPKHATDSSFSGACSQPPTSAKSDLYLESPRIPMSGIGTVAHGFQAVNDLQFPRWLIRKIRQSMHRSYRTARRSTILQSERQAQELAENFINVIPHTARCAQLGAGKEITKICLMNIYTARSGRLTFFLLIFRRHFPRHLVMKVRNYVEIIVAFVPMHKESLLARIMQ